MISADFVIQYVGLQVTLVKYQFRTETKCSSTEPLNTKKAFSVNIQKNSVTSQSFVGRQRSLQTHLVEGSLQH